MKNDEIEIVLVEDNPDDAELTIRALKKGNISNNLIHLKDGAEALEFIFCTGQYSDRSESINPKIILLDPDNTLKAQTQPDKSDLDAYEQAFSS